RRVDDERRETEAAYAPRVTVKRLDVLRMLAAGLLAPRALYELLLVEKLLRTERCRPVEWNRAHVVRGPRARELRVAPRGARRLPARVDVGRGLALGRHAARFLEHEIVGHGRVRGRKLDRDGPRGSALRGGGRRNRRGEGGAGAYSKTLGRHQCSPPCRATIIPAARAAAPPRAARDACAA